MHVPIVNQEYFVKMLQIIAKYDKDLSVIKLIRCKQTITQPFIEPYLEAVEQF